MTKDLKELLKPVVREEHCLECGFTVAMIDGRGICEKCNAVYGSLFLSDTPSYRIAVRFYDELRENEVDPSLVAGVANQMLRFASRAAERQGIQEAREECSKETLERLEEMGSAVLSSSQNGGLCEAREGEYIND